MATRKAAPAVVVTLALAAVTPPLASQDEGAKTIESFRFAGTTLGGRNLDQAGLKEHVVIVDLWGTWCAPCREAVPALVDLYAKYKHHGLEIVGFSYDQGGGAEDGATVRDFAAEQRITYELMPGDPEVTKQVPGFSGYPTILLFGRGWKHEQTVSGADAELPQRLEAWVRRALSLDPGGKDASPAATPAEVVPPGRLYVPGNGDSGVELDFTDVHGQSGSLREYLGRPLLLVLTTSWDQEAARTAAFLQATSTQLPRAAVVAWHLEREAEEAQKVEAVRTFIAAKGVTYRAFTTSLKAARETVHRFASLPTMLVFDAKGVLVARENGTSDEIQRRVRDRLAELSR
jgi:cytochrome c biogenesis protein CcmG/thiol:disulfide interchange protein DsbE